MVCTNAFMVCSVLLCVVSGRSVNSVSFLIYYEMGIVVVVGYEKYEHGLRVRNKINFSTRRLSVVPCSPASDLASQQQASQGQQQASQGQIILEVVSYMYKFCILKLENECESTGGWR